MLLCRIKIHRPATLSRFVRFFRIRAVTNRSRLEPQIASQTGSKTIFVVTKKSPIISSRKNVEVIEKKPRYSLFNAMRQEKGNSGARHLPGLGMNAGV